MVSTAVTVAMPDFMHILAVDPEPPVDEPPYEGADDVVWEDIEQIVRDVMGEAPGFDFTLVYSGSADWVDVHAWEVRGGNAVSHPLQLSRTPDVCDGSTAKPAPEVKLTLDIDADEVLDALDWATRENDDGAEVDGRAITLPFHYRDADRLLDAAALVAKHLASEREVLLVRVGDVDERWYELVLVRGERAELVPLWPWMTDEAARRTMRRVFGEAGPAGSRACPTDASPPRPSLRARVAALEGVKDFATLLAAWAAPENRGERTDELRRLLARKLLSADPAQAVPVLVAALANERTAVRETIYEGLSELDRADARSALVAAYRDEEGFVRSFIGTIMWRNEKVIETLVREGLIPAWTTDETHAKRIMRLIDDECLKVHRTWLVDSPPGLIRALEGKIVY